MSLNTRQRISYTEVVDIYRQTLSSAGADGRIKDGQGFTKVGSDVQCLWHSRKFYNKDSLLGATQIDNLDTLDQFKFDRAVDVKAKDIIVIKTSGSTAMNTTTFQYLVNDPGRVRETRGRRRANEIAVTASQAPGTIGV